MSWIEAFYKDATRLQEAVLAAREGNTPYGDPFSILKPGPTPMVGVPPKEAVRLYEEGELSTRFYLDGPKPVSKTVPTQ